MSTIQDVAREAGVSTSTISNVLNGRTDRMSRETLARVEAAIAALNFRPNRAAQQLKTGNNPMLGLLVPSIANPMFGFIAREIETVAQQEHGHRVMLGNTYRSKDIETGFFDDLLSHGVRGVIMISSLLDEQHFEQAVQRGLVVVSYDRRATPGASPIIDHVTVDSAAAAHLATSHLLAYGHQRLAFATASGQTMSRQEKIKGFLAAAHAAGLAESAQVFEGSMQAGYGDSELADVGRMLAARIAADPRRPTGVVALNDLLAFGLMSGFREAGLSIPGDVSVVGIDGLFLSSLMNPGLTTVRVPVPDMARTLVQRVIGRMADPGIAPAEFIFQPDLVERESVAAPPGRARQQSVTSRPTVFVTHSPTALQNYYGPRALAALEAVATVRRAASEEPFTAETLAAAAQDCDIIVSDRRVEGGADLLARLPRLVAFCRCAVDIRNIDVVAASSHGILVTQASAGFMASVSEWIVGMMVDLGRHVSPAVAQYQSATPLAAVMGRELRGSTLGIVGFGQIGRYLADLALAFGMRVCVADPFARIENPALRHVALDMLLAQSDFVVCLAAATPETENLMGEAAFSAMQPTAYFINASRGNLVDEAALLRALDAGRIAGCAIDVGRAPDQMPSPALARHPGVRATPHIGGLTPPAIEHQSLETAAQVAAILQGRIPPGAVNSAHARRMQARFPPTKDTTP